MRRYRNWPEVIASFARKQSPPRYILRDGTRFEAAGGFKEIWEVEDIFFKRAYLPKPLTIWPDDVVIDIGANVGVFSILAAKRTRNMVYAFEPFPGNCDIFTNVISINHLSNVILQQAAVSDSIGSASLQVSSISGTRHFLADQQVLQTLEDYQNKDEHRPFAEVMPGILSDTLEISPCALAVSHKLAP